MQGGRTDGGREGLEGGGGREGGGGDYGDTCVDVNCKGEEGI